MTIKEFETLAEAIANVVICDENEKKLFNIYVSEIHTDVYEKMGKSADDEPCKGVDIMKRYWASYVNNDKRLMFIGNKIFDAILDAKEAYAASFGG